MNPGRNVSEMTFRIGGGEFGRNAFAVVVVWEERVWDREAREEEGIEGGWREVRGIRCDGA